MVTKKHPQNQKNQISRGHSESLVPAKERGAWLDFGRIAVDVKDLKDKIEVKADIPGLTKNDIEVSIKDGNLVIKGEKKEEKEEKGKDYYWKERSYGSFYRAIDLPCIVDANKVAGNYRHGVLDLVLPKSKEASTKPVKINLKG
ncbi:MAG: Hsp20/alpha crystallin family protein [Candidatus Omnitrophica bacterium]|nr:Hsp20/alpha crystallin family protein [Candidatus Omnitrophota bacterium]